MLARGPLEAGDGRDPRGPFWRRNRQLLDDQLEPATAQASFTDGDLVSARGLRSVIELWAVAGWSSGSSTPTAGPLPKGGPRGTGGPPTGRGPAGRSFLPGAHPLADGEPPPCTPGLGRADGLGTGHHCRGITNWKARAPSGDSLSVGGPSRKQLRKQEVVRCHLCRLCQARTTRPPTRSHPPTPSLRCTRPTRSRARARCPYPHRYRE